MVAGSRFAFGYQRLVLGGKRCGNAYSIAEIVSNGMRAAPRSIFPVSSISSTGYMFVPMVFISVLRATIISFGDAGFGSWPNATELATVKAATKQAPQRLDGGEPKTRKQFRPSREPREPSRTLVDAALPPDELTQRLGIRLVDGGVQ